MRAALERASQVAQMLDREFAMSDCDDHDHDIGQEIDERERRASAADE